MHEDIIRQRFEEWCDKEKWERERYVGGQFHGYYVHSFTRAAWDIWQAAYASMREIEEQPRNPELAAVIKRLSDPPTYYREEKIGDLTIVHKEQPAAPDKAMMEDEIDDLDDAIAMSYCEAAQYYEMHQGTELYIKARNTFQAVWEAARRYQTTLSKYRNAAPAAPDSGVIKHSGLLDR